MNARAGSSALVAGGLALLACRDPERSLAPEYRELAVPAERLASREGREHGRELFVSHCALCHGVRGDGHGARRENLSRPPRDLGARDWRRRQTPRLVLRSLREGVPGTPMPSFRALSLEDSWDLVAWVLAIGEQRP